MFSKLLNTFLAGKSELLQHSVLLIIALIVEAEKPGVAGAQKKAEVLTQAEGVLTAAGLAPWFIKATCPWLVDQICAYLNTKNLFPKL